MSLAASSTTEFTYISFPDPAALRPCDHVLMDGPVVSTNPQTTENTRHGGYGRLHTLIDDCGQGGSTRAGQMEYIPGVRRQLSGGLEEPCRNILPGFLNYSWPLYHVVFFPPSLRPSYPLRRRSPMSSQLDLLIAVGHDLTAIKYYALATCTILFYDHLLTLADEIKYVWSGRKSWMFFLFVANRYFPMMYQFWLLALSYSPHFSTKVCDKTAFLSIFTFVVCTLIAQVVLTVRIYAVTRKSIPIATGFAVITASQLALGLYLVTFAAKRKGQALPPIPFDAYRLCIFIRHRTLEIAYTSVSLLYDFLAFSLIIFLATKSRVAKLKIPGILGTIAEDATRYFLVIFTSHFVLEMTLTLGRESIQLLPASGNVVYLPVMIARLMLSLKKVADSQQKGFTLGEPSTSGGNIPSIRFFRSWKGMNGREDDIPLDTYRGS